MTARQRRIAGVGSIAWVPIFGAAFFLLASQRGDNSSLALGLILTTAMLATFGLGIAAIVLMIRHLYTESELPSSQKTVRTAVLVVFNLWAAPFYWLMELHPKR